MNYKDLKTGDTIAFETHFEWKSPMSWLSYAIRRFAKLKYNHIGVIVWVWGRPMVFESLEHGFVSISLHDKLSKRSGDSIIILRRIDKVINEEEFAKAATDLLGVTKYDVKGLIWDQLKLSITGKWKSNITEEDAKKRMYCYESMAYLNRDTKTFKEWWKVIPLSLFSSIEFQTIFKIDILNTDKVNKLFSE
jgi:hypothetical protein